MIYGYARVSTDTQNIARQIRNIKKLYPDAKISQEVWTGSSVQRPVFLRLCKCLKPGDTVVFDSVSRMSRDAEEGMRQYKEWFAERINLVFIKEPHINTEHLFTNTRLN